MKNAVDTKHHLNFEATPWPRDNRIMAYRVGTCHGQYSFMDGSLVLISIVNESPGNGHLEDVFEWFEYAAKAQRIPLVIAEFFNYRFKKHCIEKRGFLEYAKANGVIKFP